MPRWVLSLTGKAWDESFLGVFKNKPDAGVHNIFTLEETRVHRFIVADTSSRWVEEYHYTLALENCCSDWSDANQTWMRRDDHKGYGINTGLLEFVMIGEREDLFKSEDVSPDKVNHGWESMQKLLAHGVHHVQSQRTWSKTQRQGWEDQDARVRDATQPGLAIRIQPSSSRSLVFTARSLYLLSPCAPPPKQSKERLSDSLEEQPEYRP